MKKNVRVCDLCDDEEVLAIARYRTENGEVQDCCQKHLEIVKELKLTWWGLYSGI